MNPSTFDKLPPGRQAWVEALKENPSADLQRELDRPLTRKDKELRKKGNMERASYWRVLALTQKEILKRLEKIEEILEEKK